jgi:hypothetical protein
LAALFVNGGHFVFTFRLKSIAGYTQALIMDSTLNKYSSTDKCSSTNKYSIATTDYQVGQDNIQK